MKRIFILVSFIISSHAISEDLSLCKQGWNSTESEDHKTAIELFKQCIKSGELSNSSLARTYRNLGIASKRNSAFIDAIEFYNKALSLNPDDPWDDYVNRGNAWSELGEYDKAFLDYERALSMYPEYNEAYYNRGILFEKQGNNEKAVEEFKKAYEYGLRSQLLYERFVAHGLVKKE